MKSTLATLAATLCAASSASDMDMEASGDRVLRRLVPGPNENTRRRSTECGVGELPLDETKRCSLNGYTCIKGWDGPKCCDGRRQETRSCVPCDETALKKPAGTEYTKKGSCFVPDVLGGTNDPSATDLPACWGECDSDKQCAEGLKCFHRTGHTPVPGCSGLGLEDWDYCYDPTGSIELSGGNDGNAKNLRACRGECDSDAQCASGLKCFQRSDGETIPGCTGSGAGEDWDYCYDPKWSFATGTTGRWQVTLNAAISGHNKEHMTTVSVKECKDTCVSRSWCKSFDYNKHERKCDLSSKSASDVGGLKTDYAGNPYDHYILYRAPSYETIAIGRACLDANKVEVGSTSSIVECAEMVLADEECAGSFFEMARTPVENPSLLTLALSFLLPAECRCLKNGKPRCEIKDEVNSVSLYKIVEGESTCPAYTESVPLQHICKGDDSKRTYFGEGIKYRECQMMCQSLGKEGCCESRSTTWGGCNFFEGGHMEFSQGHTDTKSVMCKPDTQ